ncbi:hypothetical protein [Trinickia mobilis]|uniref:hypothetical protein n=1 Tax=Trinickia mobilis TaxID=2816356 RepID=UPI001A8C075C|nr:hypothetical protein [Trinickia mobilis]
MRGQAGQAMTEALVVAVAIAAALILGTSGDAGVVTTLINNLKSFFDAYSYVLSLP